MAVGSTDYARERERVVEDLLDFMTLDEKLGQLVLWPFAHDPAQRPTPGDEQALDDLLRQGHLTGIYGRPRGADLARFQKIAIEESRLGIPLFLAAECNRGDRMVMPSPLALAASWDPGIVETVEAIVADEAQLAGFNWLLGPQLSLAGSPGDADFSHTLGTSVHLAERIAAAQIRGIQLSDAGPRGVLACLRIDDSTWAGGGRRRPGDKLRLIAALLRDSNPGSVALGTTARQGADIIGGPEDPLSSIGRPGGYEGIDLSEWADFARCAEQEEHDPPFVRLSVPALRAAIAEDRVSVRRIDDAVRRVLAAKYDLGLFRADLPASGSRLPEAADPEAVALAAARASIVLLRNERAILPLNVEAGGILVVGAAAADRRLPMGGNAGEGTSLLDGFEHLGLAHRYVPGLALRQHPGTKHAEHLIEADRMAIGMASEAARRARTVIVALGELEVLGEAQRILLEALRAATPDIVLVTLGSRPFDPLVAGDKLPGVLHAGRLGTMSGRAAAEALAGRFTPCGRLPMPLMEGDQKVLPLGHGLSYSEFGMSEATVELGLDRIILTAALHNVGEREGTETVQLYLRGRGERHPKRMELVKFQRVSLAAGETRHLLFEVGADELAQFSPDGRRNVVAGLYEFALGLSEDRVQSVEIAVPQAVADAMAKAALGMAASTFFAGLRRTAG